MVWVRVHCSNWNGQLYRFFFCLLFIILFLLNYKQSAIFLWNNNSRSFYTYRICSVSSLFWLPLFVFKQHCVCLCESIVMKHCFLPIFFFFFVLTATTHFSESMFNIWITFPFRCSRTCNWTSWLSMAYNWTKQKLRVSIWNQFVWFSWFSVFTHWSCRGIY